MPHLEVVVVVCDHGHKGHLQLWVAWDVKKSLVLLVESFTVLRGLPNNLGNLFA